uniref:Uncharacterized protein, isoform A n=1 Tax=Drosophila pseudoobscura pseudoobscura TaxID=46245 RepID=A0A0R3NWW4_DROPS
MWISIFCEAAAIIWILELPLFIIRFSAGGVICLRSSCICATAADFHVVCCKWIAQPVLASDLEQYCLDGCQASVAVWIVLFNHCGIPWPGQPSWNVWLLLEDPHAVRCCSHTREHSSLL